MRLLQALVLSLLTHLALQWGAGFIPVQNPIGPISIELTTTDDHQAPLPKTKESTHIKQIVRDAALPEKAKIDKTIQTDAYLSATTQRVERQTQASQSGLTVNRSVSSKTSPDVFQRKKVSPRKQGGLDPFLPHKDFSPEEKVASSGPLSFERGISSIAEKLSEDIPRGSVTVLNTDHFTFYSFYNRVHELMYQRWASRLDELFQSPRRKLLQQSNGRPWTTDLEVWIKPDGVLHSVHLLKESGIPFLDNAGTQAFQDALFFPNPPREKVDQDGLVRIRYRLHVYYDPKVVVR
jgi:TonB family protein